MTTVVIWNKVFHLLLISLNYQFQLGTPSSPPLPSITHDNSHLPILAPPPSSPPHPPTSKLTINAPVVYMSRDISPSARYPVIFLYMSFCTLYSVFYMYILYFVFCAVCCKYYVHEFCCSLVGIGMSKGGRGAGQSKFTLSRQGGGVVSGR